MFSSPCSCDLSCTWHLTLKCVPFLFFPVHFGNPNRVQTSPVLTLHLDSNYRLPLLPPRWWIKDMRLCQTVISAVLLDGTYRVLTEIGACLSIALACGLGLHECQTLLFTPHPANITICNSRSEAARVVSRCVVFTFIPFTRRSRDAPTRHAETWGAPWYAWKSGLSANTRGCGLADSELLSWDCSAPCVTYG